MSMGRCHLANVKLWTNSWFRTKAFLAHGKKLSGLDFATLTSNGKESMVLLQRTNNLTTMPLVAKKDGKIYAGPAIRTSGIAYNKEGMPIAQSVNALHRRL